MTTLRRSYKMHWSRLDMAAKECFDKGDFSQYGVYYGKKGVVGIHHYQWSRANGKVHADTEFSTVIVGRIWRLTVPVSGLSERQLKIRAAAFLNEVLEQAGPTAVLDNIKR